MKLFPVILLFVIVCVMLTAAGCTSSSPVNAATPTATTVAPVASLPEGTTTAAPAPQSLSWSGIWNTTWLEINGNQTISLISFNQTGSIVSGTYNFTYPGEGTYSGSLNATAAGNKITGIYRESDKDVGFFVFEMSKDGNSFTGRWVHDTNQTELDNSTLFWNGVRK